MIYTRHAKLRMARYGVSAVQIELVLREYDTAVPARNGCTNYFKKLGGRRVRVTLSADGRIVTVWKEST